MVEASDDEDEEGSTEEMTEEDYMRQAREKLENEKKSIMNDSTLIKEVRITAEKTTAEIYAMQMTVQSLLHGDKYL